MHIALVPLFPPVDFVVATHRTRRQAAASIARLRQAGFDRDMLAVMGHSQASPDPGSLAVALPARNRDWTTSGLFWGCLWAALTVAATTSLQADGMSLAWLLPIGAIALAMHLLFMARIMAPQRHAEASASTLEFETDADEVGSPRCEHYLVIVSGQRGEIATAREILSNRISGDGQ